MTAADRRALILLALGAGLVWLMARGITGTAGDLSRGAVNAVDGAAAGVARGIGDMIGLPDTDAGKCALAKAEGRTWDASFYCPAGDFIRYWWRK